MRLPTSKVYRAFPELDRFEDSACEKFVRISKRVKRWSYFTIALFAVPFYLFAAFMMAMVVFNLLPEPSPHNEVVLLAAYIFLIVGWPAIIVLLIRDRWLRWAIKSQVGTTRCFCGYSMLGLAVIHDAVVCPECGERTLLADRGLTAQMLLSDEVRQPEAVCRCGYSLRHLPMTGGQLTCPECGTMNKLNEDA